MLVLMEPITEGLLQTSLEEEECLLSCTSHTNSQHSSLKPVLCCVLERAIQNPSQQKMGLLPQECLTPSLPFSDVSADLAGPFKLKYKEKKTWILIYLCNVSKALHLQVVESYSAKSVTTALSTIFALRNLPNQIWTDAGKNLTKSRKLILESLQP